MEKDKNPMENEGKNRWNSRNEEEMFPLPQDYFETLGDRVEARLKTPKKSLRLSWKHGMAVAAAASLILLLWFGSRPDEAEKVNFAELVKTMEPSPLEKPELTMENIDPGVFEEYVEEDILPTADLSMLTETVPAVRKNLGEFPLQQADEAELEEFLLNNINLSEL